MSELKLIAMDETGPLGAFDSESQLCVALDTAFGSVVDITNLRSEKEGQEVPHLSDRVYEVTIIKHIRARWVPADRIMKVLD